MNSYKRLAPLLMVITFLVTGCRSQVPMVEKLDNRFQETLDRQHSTEQIVQAEQHHALKVPGVSAAVILPDGSIWVGASGKSSDHEDMSTDMLFGLSSVSKTYIAALAVQLAQEGYFSFKDPIDQWLPVLDQVDGNITIHQLLNHTSGLYPYQQKPMYLEAITAQPDRLWTAQEILKEFRGEPECQPGTCFVESLMDYVLLGMIIEEATGSSVSSQLTERFFNPLKLEHTYLYPEQTYPPEKMAHMWWDVTGSGVPVDVVAGTGDLPLVGLFSSLWTGGAMHATAENLARFVKALFEGNVIEEEALENMLAPGPELDDGVHYGYSVILDEVDGVTVYWHPGGAGFSSIYFYFPDDGLTIAVLGNLMVDLKPIALALYETYRSSGHN